MLEAAADSGPPGTIRRADEPAQARHVWFLGALLVAGVALRLLGWDNWSLWLDETMQVDYARRPLLEIPAVALWDQAHPPLSYIVTGLVVRLSATDIALRLPSVLFSVGAVFLLFLDGGAFRRFRPAYASAALFTFLPISIHYGQEIRPYALALFLLALLQTSRRCFRETGGRSWQAVQILAATGAVHTLYFAVFPVLAGFIYDIVAACRVRKTAPGRLRWALLVPLAVFVLYLPWLVALSRQPRSAPVMPAPRVTARLVAEFAAALVSDRQESALRPTAAAFVWVVALLGLARGEGRRAEIALQITACFFAPLVFLLAIHHWWNLRYVLLAVLPLSAAFGEGAAFIADRAGHSGGRLFAALIVLLAGLEAPAIAENVRSARVDWRRPAAYLDWQFRRGRGGAVIAADQWSWWVLRFQALRLKPFLEVGPIADNGLLLRNAVHEKGSGWIIRTPHHPVPPDVDQFLADAPPWGVFAEAESARLYRFENGRLVPP